MRSTRPGPVNPAVFVIGWAIAGWLIERLVPMRVLPATGDWHLPRSLVLAGLALMAWSAIEFGRRGTTLDVGRPTTTLVTSGPFRFSRNPVYVGFVFLMLGVSLGFRSVWALASIVPTVAAIRRFTVAREEALLEREFGDAYLRYKATVRRWL